MPSSSSSCACSTIPVVPIMRTNITPSRSMARQPRPAPGPWVGRQPGPPGTTSRSCRSRSFCALGAAESMAVTSVQNAVSWSRGSASDYTMAAAWGCATSGGGGSGDSGGGRKLWQLSKDKNGQDCHQRSIRENIKGQGHRAMVVSGHCRTWRLRLEGLPRREWRSETHRGCRPIRRLYKGETQGTRRRVHSVEPIAGRGRIVLSHDSDGRRVC